MKIEQQLRMQTSLHGRILSSALAILLAHGASTEADGKGKPVKSAAIRVTFDSVNAWDGSLSQPLQTPNGIVTDDNSPLVDGVDGTAAIVGSSFDIIADLLSSSRGLEIDLGNSLGAASTGIHLPESLNPSFDNIECGRIDLDSFSTALLIGSSGHSETKFRVLGRSYLQLAVGVSSPVNADLEFYDASGHRWQLRWGPYEHAGSGITYNPGSDCVLAERVDANTWSFTTTGSHHAALYRYASGSQTSTQVYYGQFIVPFSGMAEALASQSAPDPGISEIPVILAAPELAIVNPLSDQTLPVSSDVSFSATAFDHCLDISENIMWTINEQPFFTGSTWVTTFTEVGSYDVVATAMNRSGAYATDSVAITIGSSPPPPTATMTVAALDWSFPRGGKDVQVVITILDSGGNPVSGVEVVATLYNLVEDISELISATTNSNGQVSKKLKDAPAGEWCVTVDAVLDAAGTYSWDNAPPSSSCKMKN